MTYQRFAGACLCAVACVFVAGGASAAAEAVSSVRDLSAYEIVGPSGKVSEETQLAVRELREHVKRVCGAGERKGAAFRFVFAAPADAAPIRPFESRYRIDGNAVWFWGDDGGAAVPFNWGDNRGAESQRRNGTLFAVELFAENELGIRWLWPGEDGIVCTPRRTFDWPTRKEVAYETTFTFSKMRNYPDYGSPESFRAYVAFTPEALRSDVFAYRKWSYAERAIWLKRMRVQNRTYIRYGHAFTDWKARYFKTRPELFNWHAGSDSRGYTGTAGDDRTKRCVSNEGNVDLIIANWCAAGTNAYLNVCENDSAFYCECPGCRALDVPDADDAADALDGGSKADRLPGSMTDRYVNFWNRISARARAIRPDVKLVTYAYSAYRKPPLREKIAYPDNMLIGFVPSLMDDFEDLCLGWKAVGMRHFFLRPNFHHYSGCIPRGCERVLYDIFRRCRELGMVGVDYDCGSRREVLDLEYYVTARQMSDPTIPFDRLCEEFYTAYGPAAPDVKRYFEAVRAAGEAARNDYIANAKAKKDFLDDSQLAIMQCYGRTEAELAAEAEILEAASARWRDTLPACCLKRLDSLTARAQNAVATFRFLTSARGDPATFARLGSELIDFRTANRDRFRECWPFIFGNWYGELRTWRRLPRYLIETMDGGTLDPRGEKYGWSASFEGGCYSKWRREGRDNYAFTDKVASKGRWSLSLDAAKNGATENDNVKVLPGRRYRMSADVRAEGAAQGVRLRVYRYGVENGPAGGELVSTRFADLPTDGWKTLSVEFVAPTAFPQERAKYGRDYVECVRATVRASPAAAGTRVLVDNIRFELLD